MIFAIFGNILSRKHEYEADAYSKEFYDSKKLKSALVKLSKNNLTNLKPQSAYEFFHYSHPSILKRLEALS
jgi:STE24 endopeptidase